MGKYFFEHAIQYYRYSVLFTSLNFETLLFQISVQFILVIFEDRPVQRPDVC